MPSSWDNQTSAPHQPKEEPLIDLSPNTGHEMTPPDNPIPLAPFTPLADPLIPAPMEHEPAPTIMTQPLLLRSWAKFFISLAAATVIALHYAHPRTAGTYSLTTDTQTPATSATSSFVLLPTVSDAAQLGTSGGTAH